MLPVWKCCQRPIASFNDGGGKLDIGCWLLDIGYLYIQMPLGSPYLLYL